MTTEETREPPSAPGLATEDTSHVVAAYDWGSLGHVVDVAGGDGSLLVALLTEYATLRGTVVDLPDTADAARRALDAAGLAHRADAVAGDPLATLPPGAEGSLLCSVLRDRDDATARDILRNCAAAAGEDGAVFVIERLPRDGRTRDVADLTALAEAAGLTTAAVHTAATVAILELAPA